MVLSGLSLAAGFISCLLFACIMRNWSLVTCRTGYKRKKGDVDINTEDKVAVFGWPEDQHLKIYGLDLLTVRILILIQSLLKESVNIWEEDIKCDKPELDEKSIDAIIGHLKNDIQNCSLSEDSVEVSVVIAGYVVKKLMQRIINYQELALLHLH